MIARHEVLLSLYGVWRLFLRDPRGIEWLDVSIEGFWKSFFCAVVVPILTKLHDLKTYSCMDALIHHIA